MMKGIYSKKEKEILYDLVTFLYHNAPNPLHEIKTECRTGINSVTYSSWIICMFSASSQGIKLEFSVLYLWKMERAIINVQRL